MRKSVYLAGQITRMSWSQASDWRQKAFDWFNANGIDAYSPMRAKSYLTAEKMIEKSYEDQILSSGRAIFGRDYNDVRQCDLLFVNFLEATYPSLGTAMEMAWAWEMKKPIVCAIEKDGNVNDHVMMMEACHFRTTSFDEALEVAKTLLLPVDHHYSIYK